MAVGYLLFLQEQTKGIIISEVLQRRSPKEQATFRLHEALAQVIEKSFWLSKEPPALSLLPPPPSLPPSLRPSLPPSLPPLSRRWETKMESSVRRSRKSKTSLIKWVRSQGKVTLAQK
jgi:hypothetical protein